MEYKPFAGKAEDTTCHINNAFGPEVLMNKHQCMKVKSESEVARLCLTLSDPMDCSLPGSSVCGIFQAGVLEWGAIAFSEFDGKEGLMEEGRFHRPQGVSFQGGGLLGPAEIDSLPASAGTQRGECHRGPQGV